MEKVNVKVTTNSYDILIGPGLLEQVAARLKEINLSEKVVIVTDTTVKELYGNSLRQSLADKGFEALIVEVPVGEKQKSLETAGRLYQKLTDFYAERTTPIIALGGGVIGDLTGFVAATYMRGVPLIQIPTTLLSQGDSSIGGKVAVNHGRLKNKVGAFYHPRLTISDINTLKTLSTRELSNGLSEIIKHGVILDREFFSYLEENLTNITSLNDRVLEKVISRSTEIKAGIVEKDELDLGLRNVLNYGHTVGHAIESVSELRIWHGEAVAIGMLAEARISNKLGVLDTSKVDRLKAVIAKAGLPTQIPEFETAVLMQAMTYDKKVQHGKIKFVLPRTIGEVFITEDVDSKAVEEVLKEG